MKKLIIPPQGVAKEIDWSKPQWVISKDRDKILLTAGNHSKLCFFGTCLPCDINPNGGYSSSWNKCDFTNFTGSIPFTISNED